MTDQLREQEYTPTTEEVRSDFILSPGNKDWEAARLLAFDRWLTAHDAAICEAALREAVDWFEFTGMTDDALRHFALVPVAGEKKA